MVSQKCQYALRAVFELSLRHGGPPINTAEIAQSQAIPLRFLEVILNQLKQARFVKSVRGKEGGYLLARLPEEITVGEVIRFIEGQLAPVECVLGTEEEKDCPFYGSCVFLPMWEEVEKALSGVYDQTTFYDLVSRWRAGEKRRPSDGNRGKKGGTKNGRK